MLYYLNSIVITPYIIMIKTNNCLQNIVKQIIGVIKC